MNDEVDWSKNFYKIDIATSCLLYCDGVKFDCARDVNFWRWNESNQRDIQSAVDVTLYEDIFINN